MQLLSTSEIESKLVDINKILEISEFSPIGVPIRNIDLFIHRWDKPDGTQFDIPDFLTHQSIIETLTQGNEERIFNDSRSYNGETGPMTDILRACYFSLYAILLEKDLQINLENDFNIFISLLFGIRYNEEEDKLLIPQSEFEAIQRIILQLRSKDHTKFIDTWWNELKENVNSVYDSLHTKEFWINYPDRRTSDYIYHSLNVKFRLERGIWEKHPCYIINSVDNFDLDKNKTLKRIQYLHSFFKDPYSKECIDISECQMAGGVNYYNKYKKYKEKYLKLKSKLN
jgi:hypothetical protein